MGFTAGEVVQLKSGGPPMTVERVGKDERTQQEVVFCVWFEKVRNKQEVNRESFSTTVLQPYEPGFGFVV